MGNSVCEHSERTPFGIEKATFVLLIEPHQHLLDKVCRERPGKCSREIPQEPRANLLHRHIPIHRSPHQ